MSAYRTYKPKRSLAERLWLVDAYGISLFGAMLCIVGAIFVVCAVVFAAVTYGGRAYGRTTCANWGAQSGIATKFVVLNWADSGTCLARTPDGRWLLNSRWQAFVQGNRP